jgi:hypothetical protein
MEKIKNLGKLLNNRKSKTREVGFKPLNVNPQTQLQRPKRNQKKTTREKVISLSKKVSPIIASVIAMLIILKSPVFSINSIECKTQYSPCSDMDQKVLEDFKGKNLIFLKDSEVDLKVTKSFANRKIVVQKIFPGTLSVFVERRKPQVGIRSQTSQDGIFLADGDGIIVEFAKTTSLPIITTNSTQPFVVGESTDQNTLQAIKIMQLVYKSQKTTEGNLHDDQLDVRLQNGILAIFPLDRDPQVVVGALQLITARIRIDGKVPKSIDLRYSNPVLQY